MSPRAALSCAVVIVAALAPPAWGQEPAVVVEMTDALTFEPATVTVRSGQTVLWTNPSGVKHTVTADPAIAIESGSVSLPEGAASFNSGPVATGETFSHTFTVAGTYVYFCIPHELDGMVGTVVVEEGEGPAGGEADAARSGGAKESEAPQPGSRFVFGGHQAPRHPEVRRATGLLAWIYWLGNFHPPLISLPLGLLLGAALAELLLMGTGHPLFAPAARFCVAAGAAGAVAAGVLGWLLAGFHLTDGAWMLTTHRWLGTGAVVLSLALVASSEKAQRSGRRGGFRALLFTTAAVVLATGFFGGAMIYGLDHYALP